MSWLKKLVNNLFYRSPMFVADIDEVVIIDVSQWNPMNWEIAKQKIHGAWIRTTLGIDGLDNRFHINVNEVTRLGVLWGPYHLFYGSMNGATQADRFIEKIYAHNPDGSLGNPLFQLKPAVDVEISETGVTGEMMRNQLARFLTRFESVTGIQPKIYTRASWWDTHVAESDFSNYWLWVAHYTSGSEPWIPRDWRVQGKTWKMWQWSADGNLRGAEFGSASRSIDINRYNGGFDQFEMDYGIRLQPIGTPPPAPPTEKKEVSVLHTLREVNVRDNIIPSRKYGRVPGKVYPTSRVYFSLPAGTEVEGIEWIEDGFNTWVRVGQRQVMAVLYDDVYLLG